MRRSWLAISFGGGVALPDESVAKGVRRMMAD
jgi:hypothetical protein